MAEMVGGGGGGAKKGKGPKTKKKSTKIDMTAMVDVAFLLLTFFVLTATMSNSTMMKLTQPPKVDPNEEKDIEQDVNEKKVMTMVLCANDTVKYYIGCLEPGCGETTIEIGKASEMRSAIETHLKRYAGLCGSPGAPTDPKQCWDPIFVVKPRYNSRYANMIDILDEFSITGAKKYAIPPEGFTEKDSISLTAYEAKSKTTTP
jgi:hypothetical protein